MTAHRKSSPSLHHIEAIVERYTLAGLPQIVATPAIAGSASSCLGAGLSAARLMRELADFMARHNAHPSAPRIEGVDHGRS